MFTWDYSLLNLYPTRADSKAQWQCTAQEKPDGPVHGTVVMVAGSHMADLGVQIPDPVA